MRSSDADDRSEDVGVRIRGAGRVQLLGMLGALATQPADHGAPQGGPAVALVEVAEVGGGFVHRVADPEELLLGRRERKLGDRSGDLPEDSTRGALDRGSGRARHAHGIDPDRALLTWNW